MEDSTCQFCQQFFNDPVLLDCTHPICSKCAKTKFSFQLLLNPNENFPHITRHEQQEETEEKTVHICCPVCNENTSLLATQGITRLTRDTELAERTKEARLLKFGNSATNDRVEKMKTVFAFSDFENSQQSLSFVGDARTDGKTIILTSADNSQKGALWFPTPITMGSTFCSRFQFRVHSYGQAADGFAFVMQKESNRAIGWHGGYMGYAGIENGIAVEFDTYQNYDLNEDPDSNHIAVMSSLSSTLSSHHRDAIACTSGLPFQIADGNVHTAQILCIEKMFHVFVDDLENPLLSCKFPETNSNVDNTFFVGFTGATGGLNQENCILNWSLSVDTNVQGIFKITKDGQLAEIIEESTVTMCCEGDGNRATLHCEGCKDNYCKKCFERQHAKKWGDHKTNNIDANLPAKNFPTCTQHGNPLDRFCQADQMVYCYQCFESGEHTGHQHNFVSFLTTKIDTQICEKLVEVDKQIQQVKQSLGDMTNLKEKMTKTHAQFTSLVQSGFNRVIEQLERKRDALVTESELMERTGLGNITLQQEALKDLLNHKTDIIAQTKKYLSGDDVQADLCKKMLEMNQDILAPMLICCEGDISANVNVSPVEEVIDKLASIERVDQQKGEVNNTEQVPNNADEEEEVAFSLFD